MSETALATHQLCKTFDDVKAVDGLNLTVPRGALYGFVGLNGAGKTTTLRLVTGLLRPTSGEITLGGITAPRVSPRQLARVTGLIDGPSFFGRLSGRENLRLLAGLSGRVAPDEVTRLLGEVDLISAADRAVSGYSLGMRQRLGLALALAGNPELVILDEPTNGLDPEGIAELRQAIQRLNREHGLTIVISSHLLIEIEKLATTIGVIRGGRLVAEGPTETLLRPRGEVRVRVTPIERAAPILARFGPSTVDADGATVRLGSASPADLADALVSAGCRLDALAPRHVSLEELVLGTADAA